MTVVDAGSEINSLYTDTADSVTVSMRRLREQLYLWLVLFGKFWKGSRICLTLKHHFRLSVTNVHVNIQFRIERG